MSDLTIAIIITVLLSIPGLLKKLKGNAPAPGRPPENDADDELDDEPVFQPRRPSPPAPSSDAYEEMLRRAAAKTEAARREEMLRCAAAQAEAARQEELLQQKRLQQEAARAAASAPVATSAQIVSQSLATAYPQGIRIAKAARNGIHRPTRVSARGRGNVRQAIIMSEVIARPRAYDL